METKIIQAISDETGLKIETVTDLILSGWTYVQLVDEPLDG